MTAPDISPRLPRYGIKHLIDSDNVLDWPRDLRRGPDVVIAADADAQIAELRAALTAEAEHRKRLEAELAEVRRG